MCHGADGGDTSSLIGRVRLYLGGAEGRLVNRLDRETSGVVVIAKGAAVARELGRLFSSGTVTKIYQAIVHGHVERDQFVVDAPLGRDERSQVAIKDCVRADGARARTEFAVRSRFIRDGRPFSHLEATPRTGRKHQIRIHLTHAGYPIVGDKIYGTDEQLYLRFVTRKLTAEDEAMLLVPHHLLHAQALAFEWRGVRCEFAAGPPDSLLRFSSSP